jgi:RHS repeat-associated protein
VEKNGVILSRYEYDGNGNRLLREGPEGITTADYDAQDRLLRYGNTTYAYTANGDLASRTQGGQTVSYDYDELGNLRGVTLADGIRIDYVLDGQSRRIGKKVNGTLVQGFLYKDQLEPVAELNGAGGVVAVFIYGSRPHVPDTMLKGGRTYRIVTDHLGSPRLVIDTGTGEIVQRMDYDEYGKVILDTNPRFQPFGFAGGLYDPQTGLVRFGARDYDPEVGRWTAKDPIGFSSGGTNAFVYSSDDPVNRLDPEGRFAALAVALVPGGLVVLTVAVIGYEVWIHTPAGEEWLRDASRRFPLPPFTAPAESRRIPPWAKPGAPGRTCPGPTAIPGARPKTKDFPPLTPAAPEANEPPKEEDLWSNKEKDDFLGKISDFLENLGNLPGGS